MCYAYCSSRDSNQNAIAAVNAPHGSNFIPILDFFTKQSLKTLAVVEVILAVGHTL